MGGSQWPLRPSHSRPAFLVDRRVSPCPGPVSLTRTFPSGHTVPQPISTPRLPVPVEAPGGLSTEPCPQGAEPTGQRAQWPGLGWHPWGPGAWLDLVSRGQTHRPVGRGCPPEALSHPLSSLRRRHRGSLTPK